MLRFVPVVIGALISRATANDSPLFDDATVSIDQATVTQDDACHAHPNGEECSLSLRQLRGDRVSWLQTDAGGGADREGEDGDAAVGFCCRTPTDENDVCGSCGDTSSEMAGNFCNSRSTCSDCGGTWCLSQCVLYGSCESPAANNLAASGTFCALSPDNCKGCSGTWCTSPVTSEGEEEDAGVSSMPTLARPVSLVETEKARGGIAGASSLQKPGRETEGQIDDDDQEDNDGEIFAMAPRKGSEEGQIDEDDEEDDQENFAKAPHKGSEDGQADDSDREEGFAAKKANATSLLQVKVEEDEGFCCYSGQDTSHPCGSCWPTAIAESTNWCASQGTCSGCGGSWCTYQCVFSGSDPNDVCKTAYTTAIAPPGHYCSQSRDACVTCKGTYCAVEAENVATTPQEAEDEGFSDDDLPPQPGSEAENPPPSEDGVLLAALASAVTQGSEEDHELGFCCHAAANQSDVCGTCWPRAKALEGDWCATKSRCSSCGDATWCPAQCVYAGSDPSNICATAYEAAIAPKGDYCAKSEKNCLKCHGNFCPVPR